jgi:two-component system, LytTR family, sensor kinase
MEKNQSVLNSLFQKRYSFQLLFWVMYAVFLVLFTQSYIEKKGWLFSLMPLSLYMVLMGILVYGHTLLLIPRFLERKQLALYVSGLVILILFYTFAESVNQQFWNSIIYPGDNGSIPSYFIWNIFYAFCFILNSTLLYFTQKWSEQRQQVNNIQISQLETELKYLRSQINPHFLFNGLNTIYGIIDIENNKARDIVVQFSDLLRYNLYEADTELVEIGKEAVYLENYVALQKARSNDNLKIILEIQIADQSLKIAPLIFVAFIENAFKYTTRKLIVNEIFISLKQSGKRITFECRNPYTEQVKDTKGIGLVNVTRRLELIYREKYKLYVTKDKGIYTTSLIIDL